MPPGCVRGSAMQAGRAVVVMVVVLGRPASRSMRPKMETLNVRRTPAACIPPTAARNTIDHARPPAAAARALELELAHPGRREQSFRRGLSRRRPRAARANERARRPHPSIRPSIHSCSCPLRRRRHRPRRVLRHSPIARADRFAGGAVALRPHGGRQRVSSAKPAVGQSAWRSPPTAACCPVRNLPADVEAPPAMCGAGSCEVCRLGRPAAGAPSRKLTLAQTGL